MPLDSVLAQLEDAQLIRFAPEGEPAYIFKNVLSQQAAYQSLLSKNRRELHRDVAETYEKLYGDSLDEIAPLLAQHYSEAGDRAKTFEYSVRAAQAAMRVYANAEAIEHYSRAIELATSAPSPLTAEGDGHRPAGASLRELYLNRGRALELSGRYDEVLKNYEEMETLGHAQGDRAMELAALIALATVRSTPTTLYDATLARSLSDWALKVAREIGDRASEAKILWNLANHSLFSLQVAQGIEYGEKALAIARELGMTEQTAYILNDINRLYLSRGEIKRARELVEQARPLWQELKNLPMLADNYASAAEIHQYAGQLDSSLKLSQAALDLARSIGNSWMISDALSIQAYFYFERGEIDKTIEVFDESVRYADQAGFVVGGGLGRGELGLVYAYLGANDRGLAYVEQILRDVGTVFEAFRPLILAYHSRVNTRKGDLRAAEAASKQALEQAAPNQFMIYISAPIALADGELALAKKDYAHALAAVELIVAKARETGAQYLLLDAFLVQGDAYLGLGELDQAEKILVAARERAEAMGSRRTLWLILLGLSRVAERRGDATRAKDLRVRARAIVEFIAQHISDQTLRDSFLALPTVQAVMQ